MYGPTLLQSTATSEAESLPPGMVRLTTASLGAIVRPSGSAAMCQLGAILARGNGADQVRYAVVGEDCAAPVGTRIENVDDQSTLGTVAAVATGTNGAWSAVAVRLDDGVGWMSMAPAAVIRSRDKVDVQGLGEHFSATIDSDGLLHLDGFSSPFGRSGASVFSTKGRLVGISAGTGSLAVPIAELIRTFAAIPGFGGVALL